MPATDRYYPRVDKDYLWYSSNSGVYERSSSICYCAYGKSKEEALKILDEYLETKGKGSQIIKLC